MCVRGIAFWLHIQTKALSIPKTVAPLYHALQKQTWTTTEQTGGRPDLQNKPYDVLVLIIKHDRKKKQEKWQLPVTNGMGSMPA